MELITHLHVAGELQRAHLLGVYTWRPVASTLSNQNGAGFGSLPAQGTLTDSTESCGGAFCMAA